MKLTLLGISLLSLFIVVTGAQADTLAATDVSLLGGPVVADQGPFTSSVTIDSNNFANAVVNAAAGTMGVEAVSGPSNRADATASHGDTWTCVGTDCNALVPVPVSLGVFLDGSATLGPTNDAHLEATYGLGAGFFKFVFDQADGGFGASATFTNDSGIVNIITIPVTVNDNGSTVDFSVNFSTTEGMPSTCSSTPDHPCFQSDDNQTLNAFTNGGSVFALHTFGVTITSLDPNIQLTSADGRTGGTTAAAVPEPTMLTLLGPVLVAIAVRFRSKRR
jgi:hypothetical protein